MAELELHSRTVIIGIAGGSASGKSLLAKTLAESTRSAVIVEQDAYYLPVADASANFDHPDMIDWRLLEQHIHSLLRGVAVCIPTYDFATHRRLAEPSIAIASAPLLLLEGLHVLVRPTIRALVDVAVYVDTPADLRLLRRIRRDMATRGRDVANILEQYERSVRPMHEVYVAPSQATADLILDGTRPPGDNVATVRAFATARALPLRWNAS